MICLFLESENKWIIKLNYFVEWGMGIFFSLNRNVIFKIYVIKELEVNIKLEY